MCWTIKPFSRVFIAIASYHHVRYYNSGDEGRHGSMSTHLCLLPNTSNITVKEYNKKVLAPPPQKNWRGNRNKRLFHKFMEDWKVNGEVITNLTEQRKLKYKHLRGGFPMNNELETESLSAWTTHGRSEGVTPKVIWLVDCMWKMVVLLVPNPLLNSKEPENYHSTGEWKFIFWRN